MNYNSVAQQKTVELQQFSTSCKEFHAEMNELRERFFQNLCYKLLNKQAHSSLFKTQDIADYLGCSSRQVGIMLTEFKEAGKLTWKNRGRNGILITMLKGGWELTKKFFKKFAFLAYFRDKGLIPYIDISNTTAVVGKVTKEEMMEIKKEKNEVYSELQSYGFGYFEIKAIVMHVKRHRIGSGALKLALNAYVAYIKNNEPQSKKALFVAILDSEHKTILETEDRERRERKRIEAVRLEESKRIQNIELNNIAIKFLNDSGIFKPRLSDFGGDMSKYTSQLGIWECKLEETKAKLFKQVK